MHRGRAGIRESLGSIFDPGRMQQPEGVSDAVSIPDGRRRGPVPVCGRRVCAVSRTRTAGFWCQHPEARHPERFLHHRQVLRQGGVAATPGCLGITLTVWPGRPPIQHPPLCEFGFPTQAPVTRRPLLCSFELRGQSASDPVLNSAYWSTARPERQAPLRPRTSSSWRQASSLVSPPPVGTGDRRGRLSPPPSVPWYNGRCNAARIQPAPDHCLARRM